MSAGALPAAVQQYVAQRAVAGGNHLVQAPGTSGVADRAAPVVDSPLYREPVTAQRLV